MLRPTALHASCTRPLAVNSTNGMKIIKGLGIATSLSYIVSYAFLFGANSLLLQEVEYLSVTGFNIEGLQGQYRIMILNYALPGLLMALFGLSLSKEYRNQTEGRIGSYLLVFSGICWLSFAFNPLIPGVESNNSDYLPYIKSFFTWVAGAIAIILISLDSSKGLISKSMKWVSLLFGTIMLLSL